MEKLDACPVCSGTTLTVRFQCGEVLGTHLRINECAACGLGFVNPAPSWAELAPFYDDK